MPSPLPLSEPWRHARTGLWMSIGLHAVVVALLCLWTYHLPIPLPPTEVELTVVSVPARAELPHPTPVPPAARDHPVATAQPAVAEASASEASASQADVSQARGNAGGGASALLALARRMQARSLPNLREMAPQGDFAVAEPQLGMDPLTVDRLAQAALDETRRQRSGWGPWGFNRIRVGRCIPANEGIP